MSNHVITRVVESFLDGILKAIIIVAALIALSAAVTPHVGVQPTSLVAILGAAGLAIGLSLQAR